MLKIKFIYFDIGGVLNDWSDAFKTVTNKFNIPFKDFLNHWHENDDDITRGKITPKEFWSKAIKKFDLKNANNFDFLRSWVGDYKQRIEVHQLINRLIDQYKIGIISNLYKDMFPILIETKIVPNINYSAIILSCDVGLKKPEKEIYEIGTKKTRVKPEEILLIDDRLDFIEGAKVVGWKTFWFNEKNVTDSVDKLQKLLL